jgi:heterodisulfide reductase subunit B
MRYWYYPGCSLHSTASEYDRSARAVARALDVDLVELHDWNCCGASSVHSLFPSDVAMALPARNVLLAQREPWDMAVPCADCFCHSAAADDRLRADLGFRAAVEAAVGGEYSGQGRPRTLLDVLASDVPLNRVKAKVTRPLPGLHPAGYYGCLLVRPPAVARHWDDPEHPVLMDQLLSATGAQPVKWSYAVECCGASLAIGRGDVVARLVGRIVDGAEEAGANCLVTACPMCQANLESRQGRRRRPMPVFYFTEFLGVAFGVPHAADWLKKHLIDPRPFLAKAGVSLSNERRGA